MVDIADEMPDVSRKRFSGLNNVQHRIMDYTKALPEDDFDAVISVLSIHHLEDAQKEKLFIKIYDMLPENGIFVNYDQFCADTSVMKGWFDTYWERQLYSGGLSERDIELWRERRKLDKECSVETEMQMLDRCGFSEVKCIYSYHKFSVTNIRLFELVFFWNGRVCFQAFLIIVLVIILRGFKRKYLFSFITAFIYGNVLDVMMRAVALISVNGIIPRVAFYVIGLVICAVGVSLLFHTYISPEAYELFVKEISSKFCFDINKTKTIYDCGSCIIAVIMSFLFMGFLHFEGVKAGTILCAVINGWVIGQCSRLFEKNFDFKDAFDFRKYFE